MIFKHVEIPLEQLAHECKDMCARLKERLRADDTLTLRDRERIKEHVARLIDREAMARAALRAKELR